MRRVRIVHRRLVGLDHFEVIGRQREDGFTGKHLDRNPHRLPARSEDFADLTAQTAGEDPNDVVFPEPVTQRGRRFPSSATSAAAI